MSDIKTTYQPARLFFCLLLAALIFASWKIPATRAHWDALDRFYFFWANGSLSEGHNWQVFWAAVNYRAFDLIPGSFLIAIFLHDAWKNHRDQLLQRIVIGGFIAVYCLQTVQAVRLLVLEPRISPTLVLEPANRLTQLVPYISSKDNSTFSFPGDHATVMFLVACFIGYFCSRRHAVAAFLIAILCSIPRTVGGAHWLTDVLISASVIPLAAVSIAIYTPLGGIIIGWVEIPVNKFIAPILRRYLPFI